VFVTGAARHRPRDLGSGFSERGARVAIADIDDGGARRPPPRSAGGALRRRARREDGVSVRAAVSAAIAHFGRIDALVNERGWDKVEPFVESSGSDLGQVLAINLRGPIAVTRAVLDGMIERRAGWIVSISSDAGRVGSSGEVVCSAAKAGVIGFSRALARGSRATVRTWNVVCPSPTNTPLLASVGADNPNLVQALAKAVPFRPSASPTTSRAPSRS
jgi:2-hydroxycyclohexanecarboxyl-CoA dehydrogenase